MNELDAIKARREAISHMVRDTTTRRATAYDAQATAAFIAAAPADVDTLLAMVERLTGEVAEYKAGQEDLIQTGLSLVADRSRFRSAILSLTPGGSEFYDEPERCAEWARERMANAAKLAKERNELRAEVERLTGELAEARLTVERDALAKQLRECQEWREDLTMEVREEYPE